MQNWRKQLTESEVSEVQWRDITGIVRGSFEALDRQYLERASSQLEVRDLLVERSTKLRILPLPAPRVTIIKVSGTCGNESSFSQVQAKK